LEGDFETAAFKKAADGGSCDAFSQRRYYAAGYKDVFRGGAQSARIPPSDSAYSALCSEIVCVSNRVRNFIFHAGTGNFSGSSALLQNFLHSLQIGRPIHAHRLV